MTLRMFVECLGCRNDGDLAGDWFDADDVPSNMEEFNRNPIEVGRWHVKGQHEELWVTDSEGFDGFLDGEFSPITGKRAAEVIAAIEADGIDAEAVAHWIREIAGLSVYDFEWDGPTSEKFRESYCGPWDSVEDYVRDFYESTGSQELIDALPEPIRESIDWEEVATHFDGDLTEVHIGNQLHIFTA